MNQPPEHPLPNNPSHTAHNAAPYRSINFAEKFALFQDQWRQKIAGQMNDYQFKLARLQGDFIWHEHAETDETFIVIEGQLRIDFQDGHVLVSEGEMYVVPKGVMHKPFAEHEVKLLLIEPCGTVNTGDAGGERTVSSDVWI